ncbi:hypothetical protein Vafri_19048, partial [Volvox africanus]
TTLHELPSQSLARAGGRGGNAFRWRNRRRRPAEEALAAGAGGVSVEQSASTSASAAKQSVTASVRKSTRNRRQGDTATPTATGGSGGSETTSIPKQSAPAAEALRRRLFHSGLGTAARPWRRKHDDAAVHALPPSTSTAATWPGFSYL